MPRLSKPRRRPSDPLTGAAEIQLRELPPLVQLLMDERHGAYAPLGLADRVREGSVRLEHVIGDPEGALAPDAGKPREEADELLERLHLEPPERPRGDRHAAGKAEVAGELALRLLEKVLKRTRRSRRHVVGAANLLLARKQAEFLSGRKFTEPERVELARATRERGSIQVLSASDEQSRLTTLLGARFAWERAGMRVLGASPLWETARLCDEKTGIHFITCQGLARGLRAWRGPLRGYDSALRNSLRHGLAGFPSTKAFLKYVIKASGKWIRLDEKTVLVLDNPRAIPLSDLADLVRRVYKARAKLVVLDDQPASRVRGEDALLRILREKQAEQEHEEAAHGQDRQRSY